MRAVEAGAAKHALEDGKLPLKGIARLVGLGDEQSLRRGDAQIVRNHYERVSGTFRTLVAAIDVARSRCLECVATVDGDADSEAIGGALEVADR
jgi:hypothetical protein